MTTLLTPFDEEDQLPLGAPVKPKPADDGVFYKVHMSVWELGAKAARAGKTFSANPYPAIDYEFVSWGNGWLAAMHNIAKEYEL